MSVANYDRAKMTAYMARYRERRRKWARNSLGGRCAVCGSEEELEFDHIDRATKLFAIGAMWQMSWSMLTAELAKCQLLCKEHHLEKSKQENSFTGRPSSVPPVELVCEYCGTRFKRPAWRVEQRRREGHPVLYCSRSCANKGRATR